VEVHPFTLRPLIAGLPATPSEARFSLQHTVASALVDGGLGLGSFTAESVGRPEVVSLRERVEVVVAPEPAGGPDLAGAIYARVRVTTPDGASAAHLVTATRGNALDPLEDHELDAKLRSCTEAAGWTPASSTALLDALRAADGDDPVALEALRHDSEEDAR